jgi:hypothetical protein
MADSTIPTSNATSESQNQNQTQTETRTETGKDIKQHSNVPLLPFDTSSTRGLSKQNEWEVRWFYTILHKANPIDKPILTSYRIESMAFLWTSIVYLGCTYETSIYRDFLRDLDALSEVAEPTLYLDLRVFRIKFLSFAKRVSPDL